LGFTYFENNKNQSQQCFLIHMYVLSMCSNYSIIRNIISSKLTPYLEAIVEEFLLFLFLLGCNYISLWTYTSLMDVFQSDLFFSSPSRFLVFLLISHCTEFHHPFFFFFLELLRNVSIGFYVTIYRTSWRSQFLMHLGKHCNSIRQFFNYCTLYNKKKTYFS
jgi:hypothetical protein